MLDGRTVLLAGASLGAGLMYLLDSANGARRRARLRDLCAHLSHQTSQAAATTSRDARKRLQGYAASLRNLALREDIDDEVLKERVRSTLGHYVSHSHAIHVAAAAGVVTLKGTILDNEATGLLRAIRHVRGVKAVIDELDRFDRALHVPALQGGDTPLGGRFDFLRPRWAPATRVFLGMTGAALACGSVLRQGPAAVATGLLGLGLLARAVTNTSVVEMATMRWRHRGIDIQKTIAIDAPVGEVYAVWSLYERFPLFMSRVFQVTSNPSRPMESHWEVMGPAGVPVAFDVEITSAIPNRLIAWRTLEGSTVSHSGAVRFEPDGPRRTRAHIQMSYVPPAGLVGHSMAALLGVDAKTSLDQDLIRMKSLIETGQIARDATRRTVGVDAHSSVRG
jgi:uncharacterized membrane protein/osmotically-inducible protein OsmY